jgi:hypothetical protein
MNFWSKILFNWNNEAHGEYWASQFSTCGLKIIFHDYVKSW